MCDAVQTRRVLVLTYRGARDTAAVVREVEPLAQVFTHGRWAFLAYCHLRQGFRTFYHARCQAVAPTGAHFDRRYDVSLERFIRLRKGA